MSQECTSNTYEDYTNVTCSADDIDELCNDLKKAEIVNITEWLRQNKLNLNTDKTKYMVVGHLRQTKETNHILKPREINIHGEPINLVKKFKYLGVTVDENLTWNEHYKKLKRKIKAAPLFLLGTEEYSKT